MDAAELQGFIARGEGLHLDFKERLGSPTELAKDLRTEIRDFEVLLVIPRRPVSPPAR